jgi:hypothetical protein
VSRTGISGQWRDLGNQKQYHTDDGAVLNRLKSTKTVWFQGQKPAMPKLKRAFVKVATKKGLLEGEREPEDEITDMRGVISEIAKLRRGQKRMRLEIVALKEANAHHGRRVI